MAGIGDQYQTQFENGITRDVTGLQGKYGIAMWNNGGRLQYKSTDVTWNQVDQILVPRGSSFEKDYPILLNREVLLVQFMINPPPIDRRAIAHTLTAQGTLISVRGGSEDTFVQVLMR